MNLNELDWSSLGIYPSKFLLPRRDINLNKWSVVACDQYTHDINYWKELDSYVSSSPSCLRMILPEIYLSKRKEYKYKIWQTMKNYLDEGLFRSTENGFILVERTTSSVPRLGLIAVCDLEKYGAFNDKNPPLIQSTEGIVPDRLPPRLEIRESASLELSHALMLFDDINKTVLEPLYSRKDSFELLYECILNMNGGNIKAYAINKPEDIQAIYTAFAKLKDIYCDRNFLFAVGDGNHSIKVAQNHWNIIKQGLSPMEASQHPARFTSIEICNIHNEALIFEPIHRILYGIDGDELLPKLNSIMPDYVDTEYDDDIIMCYEGKEVKIPYDRSSGVLPVAFLQLLLDKIIEDNKGLSIDYIHGEEETRKLSYNSNSIGFILPQINKSDFFETISKLGILPRKTFSMGKANEKRYYMECRKIIK